MPPLPPGLDLENCNGKDYLGCWDRYWAWTKTDAFKAPMREIALADDFLKDNYLSTELRVPSTLMQTNICSPIATNAIAGNIWDNFSSQSYKELPSVGSVKLRHPLTGAEYDYTLPGGGRGFTRPASLISLWSTAPFLQNNSRRPVQIRARRSRRGCASSRPRSSRCCGRSAGARTSSSPQLNIDGPGVGWIQRTTADSHISVPQRLHPGRSARAARHRPAAVPVVLPERRSRDRADSQGHAGQPPDQHGPARRRPARGRAHAST